MPRAVLRPKVSELPPPTAEGEEILTAARETSRPLQIIAFAGCGKTTMLNHLQRALPQPVLCLAFNARITKKMQADFDSNTTVKSFNGLGYGIWRNTCSRAVVLDLDGNGRDVKVGNLLKAAIAALPKDAQREAYDEFSSITAAVALAKSLGYVPRAYTGRAKRLIDADAFYASLEEQPSDLLVDLTEAVLLASIKAAYQGRIDFNDQIYMPALFGGAFPRFENVLVDETQDLNPVNHEMLRHLKGSRVSAVGDPWQSIYAFRGAVQEGMRLMRDQFDMLELPLSVSFRCPEKVVRNAQWRAPTMKWIKPGGTVGRLKNPEVTGFPDGCAIICRNNAPLFALAIRLITAGRSATVAGSDVGPRVINILRKLGAEEMNREQTLSAIEDWRAERNAKGSTTANDIADCMRVFAGLGDSLGQAVAYAADLLQRKGTIHLSTGHKAKGLEWPIVYHLDPWIIKGGEQELNLRYVIQTRALEAYFEIESEEIRWST